MGREDELTSPWEGLDEAYRWLELAAAAGSSAGEESGGDGLHAFPFVALTGRAEGRLDGKGDG